MGAPVQGERALLPGQRQGQILVDVKMSHLDDDLKKGNRGICELSYCTTLYLCLTIVLVLTVICTSGIYLYDEYGQPQPQQFQGWCNIPMSKDRSIENLGLKQTSNDMMSDDFENLRESFDLGLSDDSYANIDVPNFEDGKPGRFIHDFNFNITGIVDTEGRRCFVMPLDRKAILPPRSLMDMVKKMMDGYYNINVDRIKQNMRVVTPPISDLSKVGVHIIRECNNYPIYALEEYYSHSVIKRSADHLPLKFGEFAGNSFLEFNIMNLDEIIQYEEKSKQSLSN